VVAEHCQVPHLWRRCLHLARLLLALACVAAVWLSTQSPAWWTVAVVAGFATWGLALLWWKPFLYDHWALLGLVVDVIVFLVAADSFAATSPWLIAIFYTYLVVNAVLGWRWREAALIAAISTGFFLSVQPLQWEAHLPTLLVVSLAGLAFSLWKRQLEQLLYTTSRGAAVLRLDVEKARQQERARIASDLHDGPLQGFFGVEARLEVVRRLLDRDPERGRGELARLQEFWRSQVEELNAWIRGLLPAEMDSSGLTAALSRVAEGFQKDTGISVTFRGECAPGVPPVEIGVEVLHIVREALHNVRKHAGATHVTLAVEHDGSTLRLLVEDNGKGFPFGGSYSLEELGLRRQGPESIQRRVRALAGDLTLESRPGQGSALRITIPT